MSDVGPFVISEFITAKEIHVLHLSKCARRYGSDKKTKRLDGLVIKNVNKPTATGRAVFGSILVTGKQSCTNCLFVL